MMRNDVYISWSVIFDFRETKRSPNEPQLFYPPRSYARRFLLWAMKRGWDPVLYVRPNVGEPVMWGSQLLTGHMFAECLPLCPVLYMHSIDRIPQLVRPVVVVTRGYFFRCCDGRLRVLKRRLRSITPIENLNRRESVIQKGRKLYARYRSWFNRIWHYGKSSSEDSRTLEEDWSDS